tara:strand:- start:279 stop:404 length:126 start_codon:yes stop_codon:yes gene_type:complete
LKTGKAFAKSAKKRAARAGGQKMTAWPVREKFANIRGGGAV